MELTRSRVWCLYKILTRVTLFPDRTYIFSGWTLPIYGCSVQKSDGAYLFPRCRRIEFIYFFLLFVWKLYIVISAAGGKCMLSLGRSKLNTLRLLEITRLTDGTYRFSADDRNYQGSHEAHRKKFWSDSLRGDMSLCNDLILLAITRKPDATYMFDAAGMA